MAFQAPAHAESLDLLDDVHLVDPAMAAPQPHLRDAWALWSKYT